MELGALLPMDWQSFGSDSAVSPVYMWHGSMSLQYFQAVFIELFYFTFIGVGMHEKWNHSS